MSAIAHRGIAVAAVACAMVGSQLTSANALADPHNPHTITYIARVDSPISSARAIYMVNDTYAATAPLSATGREFIANTMMAEPNKAGMRVSIPWPYSGNVHCEIDVDDHIAALVDQFVASSPGEQGDPNTYGVVACGAAPLPLPQWWAKLCDAWWCTDTSFPSNARGDARADVTRDSDPAASPPTASPNYPAL
ncbi:hypothetical protein MSM1_07990 [Mycobacterium sp. SM1]|uniref:hypothetical protein n=1 Tax=Mycobacterium sp. SM1 TaxID=2816243 RepID=UPI001BCF3AE4|nr:hypothetical protein [Mycobacterium sp. SM1]MBS4728285.1 hypothetical protein [Mycobacterium sp. SM1]